MTRILVCVECGKEKESTDFRERGEDYGLCKECSLDLKDLKEKNEKKGVGIAFKRWER